MRGTPEKSTGSGSWQQHSFSPKNAHIESIPTLDAAMWLNTGQGIGLAQGQYVLGKLPGHCPEAPLPIIRPHYIVRPIAPIMNRGKGACLQSGQANAVWRSTKPQLQGGKNKDQKGDQCRNRVARQAEKLSSFAKCGIQERLTRLRSHPPELHLNPTLLKARLHVIPVADR